MSENQDSSEARAHWGRVLQRNRLQYPNESVVRWLAAVRGEYDAGARALEMGFGSAQHLRLLLDHDLRVDGTELLDAAVGPGREILDAHPLGGDVFQGDLDHPGLRAGSYDLFLAWGVLCLQPRPGIAATLQRIHDLLTPGGRACFDFRTRDNWFCGLGRELPPSGSGYWELDDRAAPYNGFRYTFLALDELQALLNASPFEVEVTERIDWWKGGLEKKHSWWIVHCRKPS